jgi:hypothetical protein
MGLKAMMLSEPYSPLIVLLFSLLSYKDKDILEKALENIVIQNGLFPPNSFTSLYVDSSLM